MILKHVHLRVSFIMYDPGDLYFSDVLSSFENCFRLLSALLPVPDAVGLCTDMIALPTAWRTTLDTQMQTYHLPVV